VAALSNISKVIRGTEGKEMEKKGKEGKERKGKGREGKGREGKFVTVQLTFWTN
jgi:hypothetical protein